MIKYVVIVVALLLVSCNHDDNKTSSSCDDVSCPIIDASGDAAFAFIDIGNINLTFTAKEIIVEMDILDIPPTLTYNNINLRDNNLEYSWQINFDVDGDGTDANNIRLAILHFKPPAGVESQGDILEFTQKNVWLGSANGNGYGLVGNVTATKSNSKLTFTAQRSEYIGLHNIDKSTPVKFKAFYNSAGTQYKDIFPDDGSYRK